MLGASQAGFGSSKPDTRKEFPLSLQLLQSSAYSICQLGRLLSPNPQGASYALSARKCPLASDWKPKAVFFQYEPEGRPQCGHTHLTLSALGMARLKEKKSIRIPPAVTTDRRRGVASGGEPRVAPPLEEAHLGRAERRWAGRAEVSDARPRPSGGHGGWWLLATRAPRGLRSASGGERTTRGGYRAVASRRSFPS